jgi:membrane protein DedA with SNARE-associated domain
MLHWLHSWLPHLSHYGYVFVFIVVFLNNLGVPLLGKTILFGAGFFLGKTAGSLWQPLAAGTAAGFLGGVCSFWLGRRLGHERLKRIYRFHLTPGRLEWPQRYFKRHGAKAIFIARFIPLLPLVVVNLLAGMTKISWRAFLFYNLLGSAASTAGYILFGYLLGNKWQLLEAWFGPTALYLMLAGMVLIVLGVIFRQSLAGLWARFFPHKKK